MSEDKNLLSAENTEETSKTEQPNKKKGFLFFVKENLFVIFMVAMGLLLPRTVFMIATIPTDSMETTIMTHDKLFCNRLAYIAEEPERGDIIVFQSPIEDSYYIKRIIGMPGETVRVIDGVVYIDGDPIKEDYIKGSWGADDDDIDTITYKVPKDSYFVMGDNRDGSYDSRFWWQDGQVPDGVYSGEPLDDCYVPRKSIKAKAVFRIYNGFKTFDDADY